jgi:type IV pilus assembly protein PilM
VPNSPEDSYIEFEILGHVDETQMDVLMVAAPKDIVDSRMQACLQAGLEVDSVDIEAFALYRSLIESDLEHDWSDATIALVDVGASTTSMSVVNKGTFAMTRNLPSGGQALTDALKSFFKLSDEDAEAGKAQLDLKELLEEAKPKENPPLRVVQPQLDDLVREIRRSLNYYQSQQNEAMPVGKVTHVLLSGNAAKMPGLAEYVAHKLSIESLALGVFDNPRFTNGLPFEDSGLGLAVATGLAMRAHAKAA